MALNSGVPQGLCSIGRLRWFGYRSPRQDYAVSADSGALIFRALFDAIDLAKDRPLRDSNFRDKTFGLFPKTALPDVVSGLSFLASALAHRDSRPAHLYLSLQNTVPHFQ